MEMEICNRKYRNLKENIKVKAVQSGTMIQKNCLMEGSEENVGRWTR